jgi:hypothetical protein
MLLYSMRMKHPPEEKKKKKRKRSKFKIKNAPFSSPPLDVI